MSCPDSEPTGGGHHRAGLRGKRPRRADETGLVAAVTGETWTYREHPPSPALASLVDCTWESLPTETHRQTIVPDGCVDLIWLSERQLVVAGADTGARMVTLPPGRRTSGIRLLPGAAGAVLGLPASALRDQQVDLEDLWGTAGARVPNVDRVRLLSNADGASRWGDVDGASPWGDSAGASRWSEADGASWRGEAARSRVREASWPVRDAGSPLREALAAAPPGRRLILLEMAVAARQVRPDPVVVAASSLLSQPRARVDGVADRLGVSTRSLHRRTQAAVGYGPKTLARVARLRRLISTDDPSLAGRALAAGYASQAHMNDEVLRLTGTTPVRFLEDAALPAA